MTSRLLACLLVLLLTPATWADVMCVAKDHLAMEPMGSACCAPMAAQTTLQAEAGGCGPCVDVSVGNEATLVRGDGHGAVAPVCATGAATLSDALCRPPAVAAFDTARCARANWLPLSPSPLSPLRC